MKPVTPSRLNADDEHFVLARAYVPEHIPGLMTTISRATPFLIEDYLAFAKDNWVIFVGYPVGGQFERAHCEQLIARIIALHRPDYLWFIGPEIPPAIAGSCRARQSDQLFRLDLTQTTIGSSLRREVKQAAKLLTIDNTRAFTDEHQALAAELMDREQLPPLVAALYRAMPDYVRQCDTARVLSARDASGNLTAFFVVELAAEQFDTYVLGAHSKQSYVPHASDLLFDAMITLARQRGKPYINLGLGVNEGIRRFKMKWGGRPYLQYQFCEGYYGRPRRASILDLFWGDRLTIR